MSKRLIDAVVALAGATVLVMAAAAPALADGNLAGSAAGWKILTTVTLPNGNTNFMTTHPDAAEGGGLSFSLPKDGDGYTNYLLRNYNQDLTGQTITAIVSVTGSGFVSRAGSFCSGSSVPSVRIEFQDTSAGTYLPTDYWWSDVNGATTLADASAGPVNLTGDTTVPADWSDINGESATLHRPEFAAALRNVKQVNLSFGGGSCFANGVAVTSGPATFTLQSLTISS